jgi:hypothetical protein
MTKKDFILLAKVMKEYNDAMARTSYKVTGDALTREITFKLSDALATTNPAFDRTRFLEACGITE